MQLEWMGKYRELIESIIHLCNIAAIQFTSPLYVDDEVELTAHQIQIVEYALERKDANMTMLANRIGISKSVFSRNVSKLINQGLIRKEHRMANQKEFYLYVTPKGAEVYERYSRFIYERSFREMFRMADQVPREYIDVFEKILQTFTKDMLQGKNFD